MRPLRNKNRKNRTVKKKMVRYVKEDLVMTIKTPSSSRSSRNSQKKLKY